MAASPHWHLQGSPGHGYSGEEARQLLGKRFDWASSRRGSRTARADS
ncbi:hypothetical protein WKI68_44120 [Streptomyces sp. MS1.HAVA.3]|uniref:Uncharacterized protein n=1 Tax=Streptomyces caledonius TaxID=3134107 RepID=A0ABU8UEQ2_9ACTN